jgi:hypothetical protein
MHKGGKEDTRWGEVRERDNLEDVDIDGSSILNWVLKETG